MELTEDKLEEELLKGKSQEQIAEEFDCSQSWISQRLNELPLKRLNRFSVTETGGAVLSFKSRTVDKIREVNDIEDGQSIYFDQELTEDGGLLLEFSGEKWEKQQKR